MSETQNMKNKDLVDRYLFLGFNTPSVGSVCVIDKSALPPVGAITFYKPRKKYSIDELLL